MMVDKSFHQPGCEPLVVASVNTSEMLISRGIFLAAFLALAVFAGFVSGADGPWRKTLLFGLLFLTPLGIALVAEMRYPKKIWLSDTGIRIAFWHRSQIEMPFNQVELSLGIKDAKISDRSSTAGSARTVTVPRSFPNFDEVVEVLRTRARSDDSDDSE